ncbi:MAG TPA: AAA family ATPase, partial [Rubellimicrobium sp.]|nr:AAA family ATPase [Rubellimicrobium sp.]
GQSARLLPQSDDPQLAVLQQTYDDLTTRRAGVVQTFGPDHPEVRRLDDAIETQRDRLFEGVRQAAATARGDLAVAEARVAAIREALGGAIQTNADAGQSLVELRALEQRAEAASNLYESLLLQSERVSQQGTLPVAHLRVLSLAPTPLNPSAPSATRVLALGLVLSLLAALVHTALREMKDRYVRTGADVTERLGQNFLGYLPILKGISATIRQPAPGLLRGNSAGDDAISASPPAFVRFELTSVQEPQSLYVETLRRIRLASDLAWTGKGGRIIGVTSLQPGEGKTTVSANLAAVMASGGRETLLVDADLRRADLSLRLGLTGQLGLVSVAMHQTPVENVMSRIAGTEVHVIGCEGRHAGAFAYDVLNSPALQRTLRSAKESFHTVILDLAPLGPVVDTRLLLGLVDQVVLVAEWGRTPRQMISYTLDNEPQLRSRLLGVALSRVNVKDLHRYAAIDIQPGYETYYGSSGASS